MKFLVEPRLNELTVRLNNLDLGDRTCVGRVEAYSCKRAGDDKRMASAIERNLEDELSKAPQVGGSPIDVHGGAATKKLLIDFITTMNHSFPDYDFSELKPSQFEQEIPDIVFSTINQQVLNAAELSTPGIRNEFWSALDEVIELNQCEIFSLTLPDDDDDENSVFARSQWSCMLFFHNRKAKKIVFVMCAILTRLHSRTNSLLPHDSDGDEADYVAAENLPDVFEPADDDSDEDADDSGAVHHHGDTPSFPSHDFPAQQLAAAVRTASQLWGSGTDTSAGSSRASAIMVDDDDDPAQAGPARHADADADGDGAMSPVSTGGAASGFAFASTALSNSREP